MGRSKRQQQRFWADVLASFNDGTFYQPKYGETKLPYAVGGRKYRVNIDVTRAPRTVDVPSAKPGRAPVSAVLVTGKVGGSTATGEVRIGADRVFFDAETDGKAIVEVTY